LYAALPFLILLAPDRLIVFPLVLHDCIEDAGHWDNLCKLAGGAARRVAELIRSRSQSMLITYPGLLARYGQLGILLSEPLRVRAQTLRPLPDPKFRR
jgi:hypothetical protein